MVLIKKWWPWPSLNSKRYETLIRVRCLKWAGKIEGGACTRLRVEIRWKGNGKPFRDVKRSCTKEGSVDQNGVVSWNEEFIRVCTFSGGNHKEDCFSPLEVDIFILNASDQGQKNKLAVAGPEVLNLASFTSIDTEKELEICFPSTSAGCSLTLCLTVHLRELKTIQEPPKTIQRSLTVPSSAPFPSCFGVPATLEEDESPTPRISLRKANSLKVSPDNEGLIESPGKVNKNSFSYGNLKLTKFQMLIKKLSFKSAKIGGEPLPLNSGRQLRSPDKLPISESKTKESLMISEFGDDSIVVGSWVRIALGSRDGLLELQTRAFFAEISQTSEDANGESACAILVALLAHWILSNDGKMPILSDFNSLIREGSLQWRNLCKVKSYMDKFPDKHFDLETILKDNIWPISADLTNASFQPEWMENVNGGIASFDSIWGEISKAASEPVIGPLIYIVGWNDHFFILKADSDAYFIIDTLGARLHEECKKAYMLKFDKDTTIRTKTLTDKSSSLPKRAAGKLESRMADGEASKGGPEGSGEGSEAPEEEAVVVCRGKEACKEYIKSFLASIPISQLQGREISELLRNKVLQIDFHCTTLSSTPTEIS